MTTGLRRREDNQGEDRDARPSPGIALSCEVWVGLGLGGLGGLFTPQADTNDRLRMSRLRQSPLILSAHPV